MHKVHFGCSKIIPVPSLAPRPEPQRGRTKSVSKVAATERRHGSAKGTPRKARNVGGRWRSPQRQFDVLATDRLVASRDDCAVWSVARPRSRMGLDHVEAGSVALAAQLSHRTLVSIDHDVVELLDCGAFEEPIDDANEL